MWLAPLRCRDDDDDAVAILARRLSGVTVTCRRGELSWLSVGMFATSSAIPGVAFSFALWNPILHDTKRIT